MHYGPSNGWLDGQPAVLERQIGEGSITYVGAWLDPKLMSAFTASWVQQAGVQPIVPHAPEGVEVCERSGEGKDVLILINHSTEPQHIPLPTEMTNLLSASHAHTASIDLPKFGVAVLQK
jgi:beta-galactosidase